MASLTIPQLRKISDIQFVGDLTVLFERRRVKCGEPSTFENFAIQLASNNALSGDLFTLCTAISHMAAEDLTGEQLLVLVARALGGTSVAKGAAVPPIPETMRKTFLEGYEAWGNRGGFAMHEPTAWPSRTKAPAPGPTGPSLPREPGPARWEDNAESGRTLSSALGIAMEQADQRPFLARPAMNSNAASGESKVEAGCPPNGLPNPDAKHSRFGAGFLYALASVMVIASGLGSYLGYRSLNQIGPQTSAPVKSSGSPVKQAPTLAASTVATPAHSAMNARAPAAVTRPAAQSAGIASAPAAANTAVPVAAGAEDTSNSIVGFAPSGIKAAHVNGSASPISGTVMMEVSISAQGKVKDARILSGPPELQAKALKTVRQWRFKPTLVDGAPTEQTTTLGVFLKGE